MLAPLIYLPDDDAPKVPDPWDDLSNPQARRLLASLQEEAKQEPATPLPVVITSA